METLDWKIQLAETETSTCGCALNRSMAYGVPSHCRTEDSCAVVLWHKRDRETETGEECNQLSSEESRGTERDQILTEKSVEHSECLLTSVNGTCKNKQYHPRTCDMVPALQMSWEADRSW